jgi:predicted amidohydrolase
VSEKEYPVANILRVAAAQFATSTDVEENLATTLRMIDTAAAQGAQVIVTPEFCNHLSIYEDEHHAWQVAATIDGPWFIEVAERARRHHTWIQVNVTLRRIAATTETRARITNTNLVFAPDGTLAAMNDKTVLMGAENDFLSTADQPSAMIDASFGRIGTYACMDGVIPEVPRSLAVRGAQLLLNSLNSFALDEASLHIPVRAAENRVWVVACCKVGPLLPPDKIDAFSSMMGVPVELLNGAGESQIVAPDGTVVAKGPRSGEAVVIADIDLDRAGQTRPDGTDVWAQRRPSLYGALSRPTPPADDHPRADALVVATGGGIAEIGPLVEEGADLIVLPELSALDPQALNAIAEVLAGSSALVVTSTREGDAHVGVLIGASGVQHRQAQLHSTARHEWATALGDALLPIDLEWGRLAIIIGDDHIYPEVARLAALASVDLIALPLASQEPWDLPIGVVERAAENRMVAVAATAAGPARSLAADLPPDFTLWAPSRERTFDGTINQPDLTWADDTGRLVTTVHPARSVHRQISRNTDLVDGRPWQLFDALTS